MVLRENKMEGAEMEAWQNQALAFESCKCFVQL